MFAQFGALLDSILGADFPKIAGLTGLTFLILAVIPGRIQLGPVVIPARDALGRFVSIFLGIVLTAVPLVGLISDVTIGLINFSRNSDTPAIVEQPLPVGSLFIAPAYAGGQRFVVKVNQRTVTDTTKILDGVKSSLYVGDVNLKSPTTILLFASDARNAAQIRAGAALSEKKIADILSPTDIIFLGSLKQGDTRSFTVAGDTYVLKVETVLWYLVGDDIVTLSLTAN